jgi:hypothetical protein
MLNNLLIYRFVIVNALLVAFTALLWWNGLAAPIFITDASHITKIITVLFLLGWASTAWEIWRTSGRLNLAKLSGPTPCKPAERDKALAKLAWLDDIGNWLVSLGLLGTVIGFWIALPDGGVSVDAKGAQTAVSSLMAGMRTALGTTILGAYLAIWHELNLRLLHTGMTVYWQDRLMATETP